MPAGWPSPRRALPACIGHVGSRGHWMPPPRAVAPAAAMPAATSASFEGADPIPRTFGSPRVRRRRDATRARIIDSHDAPLEHAAERKSLSHGFCF